MISLENKWVLITGAARGLGRLIALAMMDHRANLILVSRNANHTKDLEDEAKKRGLEAVSYGADLGSKKEVTDLLRLLNAYDIDVVFNNAGIQVTYRDNVYDTPWEDYEASFRVNTIAPMMICYALIPKMIKKGFGRILNTTSGIDKEPQQGPYSASKAALEKVTADLCVKTKGKDILLYLTDPGWCRTDLGGPYAPNVPESAVTGLIAGAFASKGKSGSVIRAQDYCNCTLDDAVRILENEK